MAWAGRVIERYLDQHRAAGYVEYCSIQALRPLLDYLAPLGVLPAEEEAPPSPVEELPDCACREMHPRALTSRVALPAIRR
jgi:hypothetical protein